MTAEVRGGEIAALAAALEAGNTTSRALVEEALERIADPRGEGERAFLKVDADFARSEADHMDALRKAGRAPSPWAGIPFSVKDLFDMAGQVTTAGSTVLKGAEPAAHDARVVARLRAAGFVCVGRTNMTEFAYSGVGLNPHYGTPACIWDRETGRIPGGSSSGAAVSVAEGVTPLALGTDTGGSCRVPAAYNGVVGYKPSHGRLPMAGVYPLAESFDVPGPFTRTVADAALADALMAEDWSGEIVRRSAASLRLGVPKQLVLDDLDKTVADVFEAALSRLERAGASIVEVDFPPLAELPAINSSGGIGAAEAYALHRDMLAAHGEDYDPRVRWRISMGERISAADLVDLRRMRNELIARARRLMDGHDGWFMPTTPNIAPPLAAFETDEDYARLNFLALRNTFVGNFLDMCAISLPLSAPGEAPVGGMILAPHGADVALFSVAAAVEEVMREDCNRE